MPSPFPGMDPYLEGPDVWPDFHHALAAELRGALNRSLPSPYYARLVMRPEIGGEEPRRIIPDVSIARPIQRPERGEGVAVAVLEDPRTKTSTSMRIRIPNEPLRHHFVEIRDGTRGHALVTLIEIVSPSNKHRGVDRRAYEAKQQEVLDSDASLIELDLLRAGEPIVGGAALIGRVDQLDPKPDYLVAVNRAWQRGAELDFEIYPIRLEEQLPCISVPLREGVAEVPLDLQYVFRQAYDSGPYARGAVDYGQPPEPPLSPERDSWLASCLAQK